MPARFYKVSGTVQGVFFRASTREIVRELCLNGWVQNADDGTVEIHVEGSEKKLEFFEKWLEDGGPVTANIKKIDAKEVEEQGFNSFDVK